MTWELMTTAGGQTDLFDPLRRLQSSGRDQQSLSYARDGSTLPNIHSLSLAQLGILSFQRILLGLQLLNRVRIDFFLLFGFGDIILKLEDRVCLFARRFESAFQDFDLDS